MACINDSFGRPINYLRISITDRCNLRCVYCMPEEGVVTRPHEEILRFEEILTIVRAAVELGINKVRITGGEPLVRGGVVDFIRELSAIEGLDDIALTTNGILLTRFATALREAGLKRVNVSLDTLKPERFRRITRFGNLEDALAGIEAAEDAGLKPVKINCVAVRGTNDDEIPDFCRLTLSREWHVRFIELMPVGDTGLAGEDQTSCSQGGGAGVTSAGDSAFISLDEIRQSAQTVGELIPCGEVSGGGPAKYYRYPNAKGTVGFIGPVTEHFCVSCNRLRLTADGRLRPCLLSSQEIQLREKMRAGAGIAEVKQILADAIWAKPQRHMLQEQGPTQGRMMSQIGG